MKTLGQFLLFVSATTAAFAGPIQVPEIDAGSATTALALVAGSMMILRAKIRK